MTPEQLEAQLQTALSQVIADETVLSQAVTAVQSVVMPAPDPATVALQEAAVAYAVEQGYTAPNETTSTDTTDTTADSAAS
jgi:DNA-binding beta-propeller fold protein YncE